MSGIFELVRDGDCLVVTPTSDLGESVFEQHRAETDRILESLDNPPAKNLVLDFHQTRLFGSTALGFFVKLWKRVREHNGRMAFCNLSEHEKEILQLTKLDHLWDLCGSRADAVAAVRK